MLVVKNPAQEGPLEKGMTTHSSILAWRIPWTEEAGGLQSMGSQRVSHDLSNLARMHAGTFLAVQWLRLCTSTAEVAGLIPSQGTEILHAAQRSQKERKNSNSSSFHWQNDCQVQMAAYMQKACFQPIIYLNLPVPFTCLYLKKKKSDVFICKHQCYMTLQWKKSSFYVKNKYVLH